MLTQKQIHKLQCCVLEAGYEHQDDIIVMWCRRHLTLDLGSASGSPGRFAIVARDALVPSGAVVILGRAETLEQAYTLAINATSYEVMSRAI